MVIKNGEERKYKNNNHIAHGGCELGPNNKEKENQTIHTGTGKMLNHSK